LQLGHLCYAYFKEGHGVHRNSRYIGTEQGKAWGSNVIACRYRSPGPMAWLLAAYVSEDGLILRRAVQYQLKMLPT